MKPEKFVGLVSSQRIEGKTFGGGGRALPSPRLPGLTIHADGMLTKISV